MPQAISPEAREALRERFPVGRRVGLRSGSPWLTVEEVGADGWIEVMWFAGEDLRRDVLNPAALFVEVS